MADEKKRRRSPLARQTDDLLSNLTAPKPPAGATPAQPGEPAGKRPVGRPPDPATAAKQRQRERERQSGRFTIDGPDSLKTIMKRLSIEYGCPMSQIALLLIAAGLEEYLASNVDIEARLVDSDTPRFRAMLSLTDILDRLDELAD